MMVTIFLHCICASITIGFIFQGTFPPTTDSHWITFFQNRPTFLVLILIQLLLTLVLNSLKTSTGPTISNQAVLIDDNNCFQGLCVRSKGKVAITRFTALLLSFSFLTMIWCYEFFIEKDYSSSFFFMIMNVFIILIGWYHLSFINPNKYYYITYMLLFVVFVFWGLYSTHVMSTL